MNHALANEAAIGNASRRRLFRNLRDLAVGVAVLLACTNVFARDEAMSLRTVPKIGRGLDERIEMVSAVFDADPQGMGLTWEPNEKCSDEVALDLAQNRFRSMVSDRRDWLNERRRKLSPFLGDDPVYVQTRFFELTFDMDGVKAGKKRLGRVASAILYAERLEDYVNHVLATVGIEPRGLRRDRRHQVFLLDEAEAAKTVTHEILGNTMGSGFKSSMVGYDLSGVVLWDHPDHISSDEEFHQVLVHCLAHNIYHDIGPFNHWLYEEHGWLYEGLSYYEEIMMFGPPITTCNPASSLDFKHWQTPYWEANIRKALKSRREYTPEQVLAHGVKTMNAKHIQFGWSYVDFLLWYDATKMDDLIVKTKGDGMSSADAIQEVYGFDLATFDAEWRKFVIAEYSTRPRKGKTPPRSPRGKR